MTSQSSMISSTRCHYTCFCKLAKASTTLQSASLVCDMQLWIGFVLKVLRAIFYLIDLPTSLRMLSRPRQKSTKHGKKGQGRKRLLFGNLTSILVCATLTIQGVPGDLRRLADECMKSTVFTSISARCSAVWKRRIELPCVQ